MDPTAFVIPCLLAGVALYALTRRVDVYAALTQGAGEGLTVVAKILPALVGLLTAVYMLRASGAMDALAAALAPVLDGGAAAGAAGQRLRGPGGGQPDHGAVRPGLRRGPHGGGDAGLLGDHLLHRGGVLRRGGDPAHPIHHSCRPDGRPGRFRGRRLGGAPVLRVKTAGVAKRRKI